MALMLKGSNDTNEATLRISPLKECVVGRTCPGSLSCNRQLFLPQIWQELLQQLPAVTEAWLAN